MFKYPLSILHPTMPTPKAISDLSRRPPVTCVHTSCDRVMLLYYLVPSFSQSESVFSTHLPFDLPPYGDTKTRSYRAQDEVITDGACSRMPFSPVMRKSDYAPLERIYSMWECLATTLGKGMHRRRFWPHGPRRSAPGCIREPFILCACTSETPSTRKMSETQTVEPVQPLKVLDDEDEGRNALATLNCAHTDHVKLNLVSDNDSAHPRSRSHSGRTREAGLIEIDNGSSCYYPRGGGPSDAQSLTGLAPSEAKLSCTTQQRGVLLTPSREPTSVPMSSPLYHVAIGDRM